MHAARALCSAGRTLVSISLKMFLTLAAGVALWSIYGFLKSDIVIVIANAVSFTLLMGILHFKLREHRAQV
jgi:MtN3 and saliva related transmembrane protein